MVCQAMSCLGSFFSRVSNDKRNVKTSAIYFGGHWERKKFEIRHGRSSAGIMDSWQTQSTPSWIWGFVGVASTHPRTRANKSICLQTSKIPINTKHPLLSPSLYKIAVLLFCS